MIYAYFLNSKYKWNIKYKYEYNSYHNKFKIKTSNRIVYLKIKS